jgi:hypothetical protein
MFAQDAFKQRQAAEVVLSRVVRRVQYSVEVYEQQRSILVSDTRHLIHQLE